MTPGKTEVTAERSPKRRRILKGNDASNLTDMLHVQQARLDADALTTPTITNMIENILTKKRLKEEDKNRLEVVLRQVKSHLDQLPKKAKKFSVDSAITRNVLRKAAHGVPLSTLFRTEDYLNLSIQCLPPVSIDVVGSFMLNCSTSLVSDVAISMPSDLFQSKDYINYRYHDKRLLYLIYIARHFIKSDEDVWTKVSLTEEWLNGDRDKPTLVISHQDNSDCIVRLIPVYEKGIFNVDRLQRLRRNVRPTGESSVVEKVEDATVSYNLGILMDSTMKSTLHNIYAICSTVPMFQETILLLDSWSLRNRLFKSKFPLIVLLCHIIEKELAPRRASRGHLFRCALNSIRTGVMKTLQIDDLNVCGGYDEALLTRAQRCAATALRIIESRCGPNDPWNGIMPYLFTSARGAKLVPKPVCTLFDGVLRLSFPDQHNVVEEARIIKTIEKGFMLTDRVKSLEMIESGVYGLTISSYEAACRKVDTRPEGEEANTYRSFWGEKATRRRFKDGKIIESLVWNGGPQTLNEIALYVCNRHFGEKVHPVVILGDIENLVDPGTTLLSSSRAITTFDKLATVLRSLEGLPLTIRAVHGTSSHLRRCGGFDLRSSQSTKFPDALDIVATFESTSAWPDNPVAIAAAKAGFYIALKKTLTKQGIDSQVTISFLDIFLGGFVFRLRVSVEREYNLLKSSSPTDADRLQWTTSTLVRYHNGMRSLPHSVIPTACRLLKRWLDAHMLLNGLGERAEVLIELLVVGVVRHPNVIAPKSPFAVFCQVLHLLVDFPWEVCPFTVTMIPDDEQEYNMNVDNTNMDEILAEAMDVAQKRYKQKPTLLNVCTVLSDNHHQSGDNDSTNVECWFDNPYNTESAIYRRISETAKASLYLLENYACGRAHDDAILSIFTPPVIANLVIKLSHREGPRFAHTLENRMGGLALFLTKRDAKEVHVVWRPVEEIVKFSLRDARFRVPEDEKKLKLDRQQLIADIQLIGTGLIEQVIEKEEQSDRD